MLIVLYKWHFYIYFIELISFNTELYSKASACFDAQMFCWNHNTHWIQDKWKGLREEGQPSCVLISES